MTDTAIPFKQAADKAMKGVSARRAGKTDDEMDAETRKEDAKQAKGFVDRIIKLKQEGADINADIKSIYDAAAEAGFDRGALKTVVKHRMRDISSEHKQNVNQLCLQLDMQPIYQLEAAN
jgi:uncharacterized protein (UPF0335 family)